MEKFIRSNNKIDAAKAYINTWLKDPTMYCNHCGRDFKPEVVDSGKGVYYDACCENPQIGRNADHTKAVVEQNKEDKKYLLKETGATANDSIRYGLSLPPRLYADLKKYFFAHEQTFLDTPKELHKFMREFPQFSMANKI